MELVSSVFTHRLLSLAVSTQGRLGESMAGRTGSVDRDCKVTATAHSLLVGQRAWLECEVATSD